MSRMTSPEQPAPKPRLTFRQRIKNGGGLYAWFNTTLIKFAGPAAVGPYEKTPPPTAAQRATRACPLCGSPMTEHEVDRSGPKPLLRCP